MRNVPFKIIVANVSAEKKLFSKNKVVAMAEGVPKLIMATTKTTEEMSEIMETAKTKRVVAEKFQ